MNLLVAFLISALPFVGAQIFIEPGQSPEQIDEWFGTLEDSGMTDCRIRMFESYMRKDDGGWDFTLFDHAFASAQKHGISIWCTLFPETAKTDIGGWKFPYDEARKDRFAEFISVLVSHYKSHPALKGWVLINEPGISSIPDTPFMAECRRQWNVQNPPKEFKANGYPVLMDTSDNRFRYHMNVSFLQWIADKVAEYDNEHEIHVNPHAVFDNYAQHDFPSYRNFLTCLGGSAHASWHFNFFDRKDYALAMMAQSEILRSGAGHLPWFMTEIQGGNNTYSGSDAMCPTPSEIKQWLWTIFGCEGKGGIFWLLNPRSSGIESGEWAMVDFHGNPTERLEAASEVAEVLNRYPDVFSDMKEIPSGIDVLYLRESAWAEELMAIKNDSYEGRQPGAVIKSAVACFRALSERGLNVGLKAFEEYDFSMDDYSGKTIIISNQIAFPDYICSHLDHFVSCGGTLLVEGLSGFFDEDLHCIMNTGFRHAEYLGAEVSEFRLKSDLFNLQVGKHSLPVHLWEGSFAGTGEPVHRYGYGKGRVIWIPSCVSLGAWVADSYKPLSDFLISEIPVSENAICFKRGHMPGMLLRSLESQKGRVLVCINKSGDKQRLSFSGVSGRPEVLFASQANAEGTVASLSDEGILVLLYSK